MLNSNDERDVMEAQYASAQPLSDDDWLAMEADAARCDAADVPAAPEPRYTTGVNVTGKRYVAVAIDPVGRKRMGRAVKSEAEAWAESARLVEAMKREATRAA